MPEVAVLKVHKAMFGTRVILNGVLLGDHLPCFTPGLFDAGKALRTGENEILIRVGAFRDAVPRPIPSGWDYEKIKFTPGIFDSVELILTGTPHIVRVQAVPEIEKQSVTVHAWASRVRAGPAKLQFRRPRGGQRPDCGRGGVRGRRRTGVGGNGSCNNSAARIAASGRPRTRSSMRWRRGAKAISSRPVSA